MPSNSIAVPQSLGAAAAVLSRPPAIWTAFAAQAAWKSWALVLLFALCLTEAGAIVAVARRPPDVVLVDGSGKSTYLNRSIAGEALTDFLLEQRLQPSDATVMHFSREFLEDFLATNSSTIDDAFGAALEKMGPAFRARVSKEAESQKLLETVKAAQIRTRLTFEKLELAERHKELLRVTATVKRERSNLLHSETLSVDHLEVELVERVVSRTAAHPDGLEVIEYGNKAR